MPNGKPQEICWLEIDIIRLTFETVCKKGERIMLHNPMEINNVLFKIEKSIGCLDIRHEISMKRMCTFRVGGSCSFLVLPQNTKAFCRLVQALYTEGVPYHIIGGGSNILPSDEYFAGVVISVRLMNAFRIDGAGAIFECGAFLNPSILACANSGIAGMERLYGIPATVGGAVRMNAGAHGQEIADCLEWVTLYDPAFDEIFCFSRNDLKYGYRRSILQEKKHWVVLSARFSLLPASKCDIMCSVREVTHKRKTSQPLEYPNAGSIFRRPAPNTEVWRLIEGCGLRGMICGGAQISEKHAGVIVNRKDATSTDIRTLIKLSKQCVYERYGICLEPEIEIL